MRHFEKRTQAQYIYLAKKLLSREKRHKIGAYLVMSMRKLANDKYEGHEQRFGSPWSALCAGGLTRQMWVLKKPFGNKRRGDKVFSKAKYEYMLSQGAEFRLVRFPKDNKTKEALSLMAERVSVIHHDCQFGFIHERDCVKSAERHSYAKSLYLLDFENAFDQVTHLEVENIFKEVFLVNEVEANKLADLCCYNGHLYQGNPMAPALFNIRALECAERLDRLMKANGGVCTIYADDVTISHPWWGHFSKGFQRTILRIIHECGLEVNEKKCKLARVSPRKIGHYDITGLAIDFDEIGLPYVRPLKRKQTLKKARFIDYLRSIGIEYSLELTKNGDRKDLMQVARGLYIWGYRRGELEKPQLTL